MMLILMFSILSILVKPDQVVVTYQEQKRYTVDEYIDKYVKTDNPALLNKIRETYDIVKTSYMLFQKDKTSCYYSPEFIDSDSGNSKTIRSKTGEKHRYTSLGAKNLFFKDFKNGTFKARLHSRAGAYNIENKVLDFDWCLVSETKIIMGYKCHKAIIDSYKGFDVVAWYSPELAISNGPMEYGGLPGLILELCFASFKYTATEIDVNSTKYSYPDVENLLSDEDVISWDTYKSIFYNK